MATSIGYFRLEGVLTTSCEVPVPTVTWAGSETINHYSMKPIWPSHLITFHHISSHFSNMCLSKRKQKSLRQTTWQKPTQKIPKPKKAPFFGNFFRLRISQLQEQSQWVMPDVDQLVDLLGSTPTPEDTGCLGSWGEVLGKQNFHRFSERIKENGQWTNLWPCNWNQKHHLKQLDTGWFWRTFEAFYHSIFCNSVGKKS